MQARRVEKEFVEYLNRRTRPNTVRTYTYALNAWMKWLNEREPNANTAQVYLDVLESSGKSPNGVSISANAIRRWLAWKKIPAELDTPKCTIHEPEYLNRDEMTRLINACKNPLEKALVYGLFDTACRIGELLELKTHDIDWENGLITITRKGGRVSQVNISEKAMAALKEWLSARKSNSHRVFMDIDYYTAWKTIKSVGRKAKLNIHPHQLRHSRAVQMLVAGTDLHKVQMHLGHISISTTANIYGRLKPMDLKKEIPEW